MRDNGSRCKVTVDGTDFRIQEQHPFNSKWYTKKHNGPGVRYEVCTCIQTGWIVWINGPFPCGSWSDLKIALNDLVNMFEGDERAVADSGYRGHAAYFDVPWKFLDNVEQKVRKAQARARHECVNRRFKQWYVLKAVFRHDVTKHGAVFMAIANIEKFKIQMSPMWQVQYYDRENNQFNT